MVIRVTTSDRKPENGGANYLQSPSRAFDRMLGELFSEWAARSPRSSGTANGWHPSVDVFEKEGNLVIQADIPGVDEKDIDLKVEGNILTIKGERKAEDEVSSAGYRQLEGSYGPFARSFSLPESTDLDKITANYRYGVLTLTFPPKPEVKPRTIKVN